MRRTFPVDLADHLARLPATAERLAGGQGLLVGGGTLQWRQGGTVHVDVDEHGRPVRTWWTPDEPVASELPHPDQ